MEKSEAASAQPEAIVRPRWRTPLLSASTVEAVTETGFTPGPDGTTYPTVHGS